MTPPSDGAAAASNAEPSRKSTLLRIEDLALLLWVSIAGPAIFRALGSPGPFATDQPVQGALAAFAFVTGLACLGARRPHSEHSPSVLHTGAVGPLTGGTILVFASAVSGLDATAPLGLGLLATGLAAAVILHVSPPLSVAARRALVSPFVLVSAGLFYDVINMIAGLGGPSGRSSVLDLRAAPLSAVFFAAFSAVYYAMLIYAPRQAAEHEGGLFTWLVRYALFLGGTIFGLGWLRVLG